MADEATTATRHRSPAYPALSLPDAVDRLERYYKEQKRASVHVSAAAESLGYSPKSSFAPRAIAALISYGMMLDEGTGPNRKVRISDFGLKLMHIPVGDPDRIQLIREAAVKPKLYETLVAQWSHGIPNDSAIRKHLLVDRNFNPDYVDWAVTAFRETYEFANLGSDGTLSVEEPDMESVASGREPERSVPSPMVVKGDGPTPNRGSVTMTPPVSIGLEMRTHTIPIPGDRQAVLQVPAGLTEDDYAFLQSYLNLMKGAIVGRPPKSEEAE